MALFLLLIFQHSSSHAYGPISAVSTAIPSPSPTVTTTVSFEGRASLLIGDAVLPIQGTRRTQILVALRGVRTGVCGLALHLTFDPAVAQIVDADQNGKNGVQVEANEEWLGQVELNQADNQTGAIYLTVIQTDCVPLFDTDGWRPVAAVIWQGVKEGQFSVAAGPEMRFVLANGVTMPPNQVDAGVISVRAQGQIQGSVLLQGQSVHRDITITARLVGELGDRTVTDSAGLFSLLISQGEGFYTLTASHPGYLSAQSSSPIQVTWGRSITVTSVVLPGGDVNNDESIDVRDLAFIAWHFDQYDAAADINGDGEVDISDLTITAGNYGQHGPIPWPVTSKP